MEDDVLGKKIDSIIKTFAEHIYITHPNTIHYSSEVGERNDYGEGNYIIYHNAKPESQKSIYIEISDSPSYMLTYEDICNILHNINKQTTLPYLIWDNARRQFVNGNYRETILNSAMAVEVAIKSDFYKILEEFGTPKDIIQLLLRDSDGLTKLQRTAKALQYKISLAKQLRENVFELRNMVIHAGKSFDKYKAKKCLDVSRDFLINQPIDMFECA